jgi:putative Ca2+/H+ antiporter (TMEM165/GDT1 family)
MFPLCPCYRKLTGRGRGAETAVTSLLFAMVASFLTATGARDQLLVARLAGVLGASTPLLVVALASSAVTAGIAAWAGAWLARTMSEDAATMFVAIALLLAAVECAWPNREKTPKEPTRSLGAIAIVLFARQLTDASRFLVAAFAVVFAYWPLAGLGGALGGGGAVAVGWSLGLALEDKLPLRAIRIALALILFILAAITGLSARGIIG